jgi:hypothetical protein
LSAASPRGFSDFRSWTRLAQLKLYPVAKTHRAFVLFQVPILRFATELRLGHPASWELLKGRAVEIRGIPGLQLLGTGGTQLFHPKWVSRISRLY